MHSRRQIASYCAHNTGEIRQINAALQRRNAATCLGKLFWPYATEKSSFSLYRNGSGGATPECEVLRYMFDRQPINWTKVHFFFHFLAEKWCLTLWWLVYAVICEFSQCKLTSGAQAMVCVKFSLLHFSEHLHLLVINIMYRVDKNWGRRSSACVGQRAKFLHGSSPYIIPCLYHKYHNDIVVQLSQ